MNKLLFGSMLIIAALLMGCGKKPKDTLFRIWTADDGSMALDLRTANPNYTSEIRVQLEGVDHVCRCDISLPALFYDASEDSYRIGNCARYDQYDASTPCFAINNSGTYSMAGKALTICQTAPTVLPCVLYH